MYISPSNIVETGYTQGHQYILPSGEDYKGFYHKDNLNRYWTEKNHTNASIQLNNLTNNVTNTTIDLNFVAKNNSVSKSYSKIFDKIISSPLLKTDFIQPSSDDYNKGYFTRYVAQLKATTRPELNIVELNKESFNKITQDSSIAKSYRFASFGWKIFGPFYDVYRGNIRIESGVVDTNLRSLQDVEKKAITGITLFITDPLQFALHPFEYDLVD